MFVYSYFARVFVGAALRGRPLWGYGYRGGPWVARPYNLFNDVLGPKEAVGSADGD
jgi:hypothetical protein